MLTPPDVLWALRRTAEIYAAGADRRDKSLWEEVLTPDCVIEGPGFRIEGRDQNLGSIDYLAQAFLKTRHLVHNQLVEVEGNEARGETCSTAEHLSETNGERHLLVWAIRYQDAWQCENGVWRFSSRSLVLEWEETRILGAGT